MNTELNIAWLAGLLDGEGCFDNHRGQPRIRLKMSDADTVIRAAGIMSSAWHPDRRSHTLAQTTPKIKPLYVTALTGARAIDMMKLLLPWLSARRTQRVTDIVVQWDMRGRAPIPQPPAGDVETHVWVGPFPRLVATSGHSLALTTARG